MTAPAHRGPGLAAGIERRLRDVEDQTADLAGRLARVARRLEDAERVP